VQGPAIRKGAKVPFKLAVTAWLDLLGYGTAIASADFNPMHSASNRTLRRLRRFHEIVAQHSARNFRSLTINDGAVFYRDLSWRSTSVTYDFLERSWRAFLSVQEEDQKEGGAGARLVLAAGFRVLGSRRGIDASLAHVRTIFRRLETQEITSEEAIRETSSSGRHSDVIPQLQANFAFTKAYVAESSGSAGGLPGSNFYVDLCLFDDPQAPWITLGQPIRWSDTRLGLSADFAHVHQLVGLGRRERPVGLRDGLAVAKALAPILRRVGSPAHTGILTLQSA
jgi:hypothetical protein